MNSWKRGKNFNRTKYVLKNPRIFIPHIRSNCHASVPIDIIDSFNLDLDKKIVCLLRITGKDFNSVRIKNLSREGGSLIFSLKLEKGVHELEVEVLDIKNEVDVLKRFKDITKFIPKQTSGTPTPIYIFDNKTNYIVGGHFKKELTIPKTIKLDGAFLTALGLYLAEGGKKEASFTNSWPRIINIFFDFLEKNFNMKRETIKASIFCNPSLKNKQDELELFWKNETGVQNLAKKLHFGKNSRSACGTLELYLCSKTLKEILVSLLGSSNFYKEFNLISGYFAGDASPILQTKYSITHHITFDRNYKNLYSDVITTFFKDCPVRLVTENKFVIYPDWKFNKQLLLNDVYWPNPINRLKFAKKFLELPRTKLVIKRDKELDVYKRKVYQSLVFDALDHYKKLMRLRLFSNDKIKVFTDEYILH